MSNRNSRILFEISHKGSNYFFSGSTDSSREARSRVTEIAIIGLDDFTDLKSGILLRPIRKFAGYSGRGYWSDENF